MDKRAGSAMTPSGRPQDPNTKVAVIRNDIEQTRAEMSRTVEELEVRLSPAHIKEQMLEQLQDAKETVKQELARDFEQVKGKVRDEIQDVKWAVREATLGKVEHMAHDARETITEAGTSVIGTLKANPIPTALIALGMGWLLMSRNTSSPRRRLVAGQRDRFGGYHAGGDIELEMEAEGEGDADYDTAIYGFAAGYDQPRRGAARGVGERVSEKVGEVGETVSEKMGQVGEKVGEVGHKVERVAHDARDKAGRLAGQAQRKATRVVGSARRRAVRVERKFEGQLEENPLAVGALALALGAMVGLALPHTRREDAWMGERKERLLNRAQGAAGEAIRKAEEAAGSLTEKIGGEREGKEDGSTSKTL
ncbi:MAG: hypothetical protein JWM74_4254 [Myxococcaceae bacterium]|nr:hypothetical protein [Myxococcaceae bacterium]